MSMHFLVLHYFVEFTFEELFDYFLPVSAKLYIHYFQMETLTVNTGADDSLHTPHVFPHIIEDSTSSNSSTFKTATTPVISSTSVIIDSTGKKSGYSISTLHLNDLAVYFLLY